MRQERYFRHKQVPQSVVPEKSSDETFARLEQRAGSSEQ